MHFEPFWNVSCHFFFLSIAQDVTPTSSIPSASKASGIAFQYAAFTSADLSRTPSPLIIFPVYLMLYGIAIQETALQCVIFFHTNFPQGCHKLFIGGITEIITYHKKSRSTASCFRCASGAQRAVRAVQCGRLAVGAHTSLTKPKGVSGHSLNAHRGLQATCFSRW